MLKALIKKKINSNIENNKRVRDFISLSNINTVLILLNITDIQIAKELEVLLIQEGKKCSFFIFQNEENCANTSDESFLFTKKDINFLGFPTGAIIQRFQDQDNTCDLLINISNDNSLILSYLSSLSKSKLKIGISSEILNLYDFMIDDPKNIKSKFLSQQIMFYLRKLKSQR